MDYYFKSIGYEQYDPFRIPTIIAEVEIMPTTHKEWRDVHKALTSTTLRDLFDIKTFYDSYPNIPDIKNVYFNNPVTVVLWDDGTKTIVKCQDGDIYSRETGLALCMAKKAMGNNGKFNDIFHKWIPEEKKEKPKKMCINCLYGDDAVNPICWGCDTDYSNWESAK